MKRFFSFLGFVILLTSCTSNPLKINVSGITVHLKIKHLDVDLLQLKQDQMATAIPKLKQNYGEFFDIFTYRMIGIGGSDQEKFPEMLYSFVSDTLIRHLEKSVFQKVDTVRFRSDLENAFKHYKHYFPSKEIPTIFTCISGFNQSVVTSNQLIGFSLDKYMGSESPFYGRLGLPAYKRRNMHQAKIVTDLMYAWAITEWPKTDQANNLLSQMIQEGKNMYFVDAMTPELDDTLKIGFTKNQLNFCTKNEASMWTYMAEHKLLFTTDHMNMKRFTDDGPYTAAFSQESPARTGVWIGWQIVRSYMAKHPEIKLSDLMNNSDSKEILNQSGYQP